MRKLPCRALVDLGLSNGHILARLKKNTNALSKMTFMLFLDGNSLNKGGNKYYAWDTLVQETHHNKRTVLKYYLYLEFYINS